MPRRSKAPPEQPSLLEARVKTAPCVPAIRSAVAAWRAKGYPGVTGTTRQLFDFWFRTDHRLPSRRPFRYHDSQREAIETLIYLYEVAGLRRHRALLKTYATSAPGLRLLQYDDFARYGIKMATGSGKTKVMSLAIAWQFFNAVVEDPAGYARTFLILAPNVIVFERLRADFAGGRIFQVDPVIPPELRIFWDLDCYLRGESERASSEGGLYLTNIQQFYERPDVGTGDGPEPLTAVLGPKPPVKKVEVEDFDRRIAARGAPCLVINDEAHHTHDESSEWNKAIRRLHAGLPSGLAAQLDFSATPRYSKGSLFTWTVYEYPLKQAIIDGVVKRPVKGIAANVGEAPSSVASIKYRAYLTAGVERWREYRDQLGPLGKKPILFVMLNDTAEANDVGDYLRVKYPDEFAGDRLLVIHTDLAGDVAKKDLDRARRIAREVDDAGSPVNANVSVLMLREGWDVQNVTVVVGRGLRLMFRELGSSYVERVDVIGNQPFIAFIEQLEKDEDMELDTFAVGKDKLVIVTIAPDPNKLDRDLTVPVLSPILARKKSLAEEIAALDVAALACPTLPLSEGDLAAQTFHYEGIDIISLQRLVERDYQIPEPQTASEVISYYARRVAQDVKLPSQFGFAIEYTDTASNLRYYEPDFIVALIDGTRYLIETKGREDVDVARKDRAATIWCENATLLTPTAWSYLKVPEAGFDALRPTTFADLAALAPARIV